MPRVSAMDKNKKVPHEDNDFYPHVDENGEVRNVHATEELGINTADMEINRWFNQLPIRILNSHQFPMFYAEDITKALSIKCGRTSLRNFTEKEIVSPALRQRYNIVTYSKLKNCLRRNDKAILLTEFGVYRLIMNSRGQLADQFRDFIYDVLYQLRTAGVYRVNAELTQLQITNETLSRDNKLLQDKLAQFKNLCDELVLVEFPNNPFEIEPSNIPRGLLKKSAGCNLNPKKNSVDDPVPHAYRLSQELGIDINLADISDEPTNRWREIHEQNRQIASEFIRANTPPRAYMVTSELDPDALTECNTIHRVYVRNSKASLQHLRNQLGNTRPDRVSARGHYYTCDREKIIAAMNAVVD